MEEKINTKNLYVYFDIIFVDEAPEDLRDCMRQAAEGCPVEIIHVEP